MTLRTHGACVALAMLLGCAGPGVATTDTATISFAPVPQPCDPCLRPPDLAFVDGAVVVRSDCAPTVVLYRRAVPQPPSPAPAAMSICDVPCEDRTVEPGAVYVYAVGRPGATQRSHDAYIAVPLTP